MPRNRSEKAPSYVPAMIAWALLCEKRNYRNLIENVYDVSRGHNALPQAARDEMVKVAGGNYRRKVLYVFEKYGRGPDAT